ncbi:MAG: hypothetical protein K8T26_15045 [Lentisphaerae bacterium]|nr:hypothetical protein [Lentisphaerota bacterium]
MTYKQLPTDAGTAIDPDFNLESEPDRQTLTECGASVRDGEIRVGTLRVVFAVAGAATLGRDGFRLSRSDGVLTIAAATRAARLSALLAAPEFLVGRDRVLVRQLRFNRRFYKHEIFRAPDGEPALARYTEGFWAGLCREIVRRHFNGVAIYLSGEPFPQLADYGSYERYAALPSEVRTANRRQFKVFLATARRYGLESLMQQYITKFPAALGRDVGIPFFNSRDPGATTADFRHPRVYDFHREMYARFFADVPLDRLIVNFESAPNSTDFCREVLVPTLGALPRVPNLFFRLWYMTNPEALCDWIASYPGDCMVSHKIMDTMDAYLYPAADSRIREWKAWFAARKLRVDWNYLVGPCHNCGSNISRRHWSDPEFLYTLLGKAERLGADGFNFHTICELLANTFPSKAVVDPGEREMARLNQFHVDAVVDFVRGGRFNADEWVDRHAAQFKLTRPVARRVFAAMRDSSRAEIMHLEQFPLTTSEGYAVEARRQLAQSPLYHPPANVLLNGQYREDPHAFWSFINKTVPDRSYPDDLQTLIDYADPAQPKSARNPAKLAQQMLRLGVRSERTALALRREMGARWVKEVTSNRALAEACSLDIRSGLALFRLYFPRNAARVRRDVDEAMAHLRSLEALIRRDGMPYIHMQEPYHPAPDLDALRRLRRHLGKAYPWRAFQHYAASVKTYNDIRRHVRPWRVWSPRTLRKAGQLLEQAGARAQEAVRACAGTRFEPMVEAWATYLAQERAWLTPPTFNCGEAWAAWQPLVHDNCFNYGGFAWADFLAFFEPMPRDKGLTIMCSVRRDADALWVRLREENVDAAAQRRRWKELEGAHDLGGITRVFLDVDRKGELLQQWSAIPHGPTVVARPMVCQGRNGFDSRAVRMDEGVTAAFRYEKQAWEVAVRLAFDALGKVPRAGDVWGLNVAANTPIKRNHAVSWCKGYEVGAGNPQRLGGVVF